MQELSTIKKTVLKAMRGYMPDEKQQAWRAVQNYLHIFALQEEAIARAGGDVIELGEGAYQADLLVITSQRPTKEEHVLLDAILRAIGVPRSLVYQTTYHKSVSNPLRHADLLYEVIQREIEIIQPLVILNFSSSKRYMCRLRDGYILVSAPDLAEMLADTEEAHKLKNELWQNLQEAMDLYDQRKGESPS